MSRIFSSATRGAASGPACTERPAGRPGTCKGLTCLLMLLMVAGLLTACSPMPRTPEGALSVARDFLRARADRDARALHGALTAKAQKAMSRSDVANFLSQERVAYGAIGPVQERDHDWVQVQVHDLAITTHEQTVRWPEVWLTLHYEQDRWRVAWAEPLMSQAAQAYQNGLLGQELELGRTIVEIDPFHYRGYLEQHYAYRGLKHPREAEVRLVQAFERATPPQLPDVHDAMARFKLGLNQPAEALSHARQALEKAAPYIPYLYSARWQADVMVVAGRALLGTGDRAGAEEYARRAAQIDPDNASLAIFHSQLNPPSPI